MKNVQKIFLYFNSPSSETNIELTTNQPEEICKCVCKPKL